jgi:hypothetical protein
MRRMAGDGIPTLAKSSRLMVYRGMLSREELDLEQIRRNFQEGLTGP